MKVATYSRSVYDYYKTRYEELLAEKDIEICMADSNKGHEDAQILIAGSCSREQLDTFPDLSHILVPYTGVDGLDTLAIMSRDIQVHNTSAHAPFVAERALALMLALRGRIVETHNRLVRMDWGKTLPKDKNTWHSLFGKRIAIYGYGAIGKALAELLKPFGGSIGVVSYKDRYEPGVEVFEDLKALAAWCDVFVVTAPLNSVTEKSIDDEILDALDGKSLINVGRGKIVDQEALYRHLASDCLGGFASDVWYNYPTRQNPMCRPTDYPIHEFDNVIMTPHHGWLESSSEQVRYDDLLDRIILIKSAEGDAG